MIDRDLQGLTDKIYASALDEGGWSRLIEALRVQLDAPTATAMAWRRDDHFPFLILKSNLDDDFSEAVEAYYHKRDPWLEAALRLRSQTVTTDDAIVPREAYLETEMYQDFSKRYDIGKAVFCITENSRKMMSSFNFYRPVSNPDFDRTAKRKLAILAPHLKAGIRLYQQMARLRSKERMFETAFDALETAVFLLTEDREVLAANLTARNLLNDGSLLVLRNRKLSAKDAGDARRLADCVRAVTGVDAIAPPSELILRGSGAASKALRLGITPFGKRGLPVWIDLERSARLACMVTAEPLLVPAREPSAQVISMLYGLTPAEAEVAILLVEGRSIQEIADLRRVRQGTVRIQVRRVLDKTDTRRQAELVAKLLQGVRGTGRPQ